MIIIGVDFHPEFQEIASVNTDTGEYQEKRLVHPEEAEQFYRSLASERQFLLSPATTPNYDVSHDGQRFLMVKAAGTSETAPAQINVVFNWFEELRCFCSTRESGAYPWSQASRSSARRSRSEMFRYSAMTW